MSKCIFCRIILGEISSSLVNETKNIIVIKDVNPKAPTHYLIIPKKHIVDLRDFSQEDKELAGDILLMAKELSNNLAHPGDFRLIANNGQSAGQSVLHFHLHFISGKKLSDF